MSYLSNAMTAIAAVSTGAVYLPRPCFPKYEISTTGVLRNARTQRRMKTRLQKSSCRYYVHCCLGRVHRVLAAAVLGRWLSQREQVQHLDGNAMHNDLSNLRVGTAAENSRDKILHGTNGRKLRNADVREIRHLLRHATPTWISRQFGVTPGTIRAIARGQIWGNLS